jgi:hypothetical protein
MNLKHTKRIGLGIALAGLVVGAAAVARANGRAEHQCSGDRASEGDADHAEKAAERFKKWDKNADGFLTADEMDAKRWDHVKVADTNNDGKVSLAEFQQAIKDGKLGHHGHKES